MPQSTTDEQPKDRGIFALLKGESGGGKSTGALSFPDVYVMDFDKKMPNIALKHFPGKKIDYDVFPNIFVLSDRMNELVSNCPYETLVADTGTSLSNLCLTSIAEIKGESTPVLLKQLITTRTGQQQLELISIDYYNGETRFYIYFMDWLKMMWARPGNPKHVLFLVHVVVSESAPDLKTKVITKTRTIVTAGRKVAAYVPSQFDDIWLFGQQRMGGLSLTDSDSNTRHIMRTVPHGEDDARTSLKLPPAIDFTDANLYEKIQKALKGDISL